MPPADALDDDEDHDDDQDAADRRRRPWCRPGIGIRMPPPPATAATRREPTGVADASGVEPGLGVEAHVASPDGARSARRHRGRCPTVTGPKTTDPMITAHQLEVRAGATPARWRTSASGSAPGDKVGLVGRNGAGKTTLTKILAGEGLPAAGVGARRPARSATCRRTRAPATPRCSPATGSCPRAASTTSYAGCARPRPRWAATTPPSASKAMRRYERADAELHAGGGYAAESEAAQIASQPRHRGADPRPAAARPSRVASAAASSWRGSCSPAPRRCCSTSRPTTSTPTRSCGCASSSRRTRAGWS